MTSLRSTNKFTLIGLILVGLGLGGLVASWALFRGSGTAESVVVEEGTLPSEGFIPLILPEGTQGVAPTPASEQLATALAGLQQLPPGALSTVQPEVVPGKSQEPAATPTRVPAVPTRLIIPKIELDAPIVPAKIQTIKIGESLFEQWLAPDEYAVGWHTQSAMLGQVGNTVLNGHHNVHGKVFERLHELVPGDVILVEGGSRRFAYVVVNTMILPEKNVDLKTRLENARWIQPSGDERLTLITCWPAYSNTHRLIVVAAPLGELRSATAEAQ